MKRDLATLRGSPRELARWQKTQQQLMARQFAPALAGYRELAVKFEAVAQLWFELGIAAMGELEFEQADDAFKRAAELSANDASMLVLLAQQYQRLRRLDRVRACFERAVAADPKSVSAQISLALWHEKDRQLDKAWECAEAGLAVNPHDGYANYVKALLWHRQQRDAEAETLLRDLISRDSLEPRAAIASRYLLAEILDQAGEFAEAFRRLAEAKKLQQKTANVAKLEKDYDRADANRRKLLAALTPEIIQRWRHAAPAATDSRRLAFLGGHPRSGTTLLEQILGAHPDIRAFDESDAFVNEIWNPLAPMTATQALTVNQLDSLTEARRGEMRRRYLKSLAREAVGAPDANILLDKNPSPTMALYLWLRIFPELKVLIALRDPRDVIVSCLFQNLELTPLNANFLSVERAAKHYGDLMDAWLRMRDLGGFEWIEVRYDDLVANLEREGRRATEFLQLPWHADQARFYESARQKFFFAPTYQEVTQPVYRRALGRWKNYAEILAPVQDRLARYCREFGFE